METIETMLSKVSGKQQRSLLYLSSHHKQYKIGVVCIIIKIEQATRKTPCSFRSQGSWLSIRHGPQHWVDHDHCSVTGVTSQGLFQQLFDAASQLHQSRIPNVHSKLKAISWQEYCLAFFESWTMNLILLIWLTTWVHTCQDFLFTQETPTLLFQNLAPVPTHSRHAPT